MYGLSVGISGGLPLCQQQAALRLRLLQLPAPTAGTRNPGGVAQEAPRKGHRDTRW